MSEDLAVYLSPRPGGVPGIGAEKGRALRDGIVRFVSPHGSYRYVFFEHGEAVSVLQVMSRDRRDAVIANVYTRPNKRREGYAERLLVRARRDFKTVRHATHLSPAGAAWRRHVGDHHGDFVDHRDVGMTVNTRTWRDDVPGIGQIEDGQLVTYHVSDDPERALKSIKAGRLMASYGPAGRTAELGTGLYVSGNPEYWINRARGKWDFLKTLTGPELTRLVRALELDVKERRAYITQSEFERATLDLRMVEDGTYGPESLLSIAGAPYSLAFWRPEYLSRLGIKPGRRPRALEVHLVGTFVEVRRSRPDAATLRTLRRGGVDGVFTRASMATNPELVVWNARAIRSAKVIDL